MAAAYLILCLRSPTRALDRRDSVGWTDGIGKLGRYRIERRELASKDPLPAPGWAARISAVIEVRGMHRDDDTLELLWSWMQKIAAATSGAVYSAIAEEFPYIEPTEAKARAKALLAAGDDATLVAWMRAVGPDDDSRRWKVRTAVADVVRPAMQRAVEANSRSKLAPSQIGAIVVALHEQHTAASRVIDDLVLAAATLAPKTRGMKAAVARVTDRRDSLADAEAASPQTPVEIQALFDAIATGDRRAKRRFERFVWEDKPMMTRLAVAAIEAGYEPARRAMTSVLAVMPVAEFPPELRKLRVGADFLPRLRQGLAIYRDGAGQRAAGFSHARFELYERYRTDPLVVQPRARGADVAMFRGLNDALHGPERDRPMLPPRIVALICDRRFDEAREAYVGELGETHADAAIADATAYFAPDLG